MTINIGEKTYELKTSLKVAKEIEEAFKSELIKILGNIGQAKISEMLKMIKIAARENGDEVVKEADEELDYGELMSIVTELIANIMFSGTPEEKENKIQRFPGDEETKNAMRALVKIPLKDLTGEELPKSDTE